MAKMVLLNQMLLLNGTDVSAYCTKAELSIDAENKDVTTFGSAGWKESIGGLKSGTLAIEFQDDYAVSALDSILWPLLGTVVTFEVRPTNAARGTSNPAYTGSVLVTNHDAIKGGVGDDATVSISLPTTGAILRQTS